MKRVSFLTGDLWGTGTDFVHERGQSIPLLMEKGQVLWTQVVGDKELLHFVGQRQGLPGSVQKGAVIPAAPGVLEGLTVPGDELKNLFRAGQAAWTMG